MTPTLEHFCNHLRTLCTDLPDLNFKSESPPAIVIAAANPLVGDLSIYDDGDELTVEIGDKHHSHFCGSQYDGSTSAEKLKRAAHEAAEFVHDVLTNRVYFSVDFLGDRCLGSTCGPVDESISLDVVRDSLFSVIRSKFGTVETERFIWSGPLKPE